MHNGIVQQPKRGTKVTHVLRSNREGGLLLLLLLLVPQETDTVTQQLRARKLNEYLVQYRNRITSDHGRVSYWTELQNNTQHPVLYSVFFLSFFGRGGKTEIVLRGLLISSLSDSQIVHLNLARAAADNPLSLKCNRFWKAKRNGTLYVVYSTLDSILLFVLFSWKFQLLPNLYETCVRSSISRAFLESFSSSKACIALKQILIPDTTGGSAMRETRVPKPLPPPPSFFAAATKGGRRKRGRGGSNSHATATVSTGKGIEV